MKKAKSVRPCAAGGEVHDPKNESLTRHDAHHSEFVIFVCIININFETQDFNRIKILAYVLLSPMLFTIGGSYFFSE